MFTHHKLGSSIMLFLSGLGVLLGLSIAFEFWGDAKLYIPILVGFLIGRWWSVAFAFSLAFLDIAWRALYGGLNLTSTDLDFTMMLAIFYAAFSWLGMALRKTFETIFYA